MSELMRKEYVRVSKIIHVYPFPPTHLIPLPFARTHRRIFHFRLQLFHVAGEGRFDHFDVCEHPPEDFLGMLLWVPFVHVLVARLGGSATGLLLLVARRVGGVARGVVNLSTGGVTQQLVGGCQPLEPFLGLRIVGVEVRMAFLGLGVVGSFDGFGVRVATNTQYVVRRFFELPIARWREECPPRTGEIHRLDGREEVIMRCDHSAMGYDGGRRPTERRPEKNSCRSRRSANTTATSEM